MRHYAKEERNVWMFVDLLDASNFRQHFRSRRVLQCSNHCRRKIKAKAFNDTAKELYHAFEMGKVYFISKAKVKPAYNRCDSLGHKYEIILGDDTEIDECEQSQLESQNNFVSVQQFEQAEKGSFLDFIGVVKSAGDLESVTFHKTKWQPELLKRDIEMVDGTNLVAMVTLWGVHAEKTNVSNNPVLVIRGAKVSEYGGGRFLSVIKSSHLEVNPNCEEAHELRKWFDGQCYSQQKSGDKSVSTMKLEQTESSDLKKRKVPEYFSVLDSNKCRKRSPNQSDSSRSKRNGRSQDESVAHCGPHCETNNSQDDTSRSYAETGGRQAETSGRQTETSGRQTETSGGQTETSGGQTETSGRQNETSGRQTESSGGQTETSGRQNETSGRQTETSGGQTETSGRQNETSG